MKILEHPNIVNLIEVIDDAETDHFYMGNSFSSSLFCCFYTYSLWKIASYLVMFCLYGFTQFSNTLMENGFMTVLDRPVLLGRKPLESICGI